MRCYEGVVRGNLSPIFCNDGAREFFKIDEKIGRGGSSKSSEKFLKITDQHQYQQAL